MRSAAEGGRGDSAARSAPRYDGLLAGDLARRLALPRVVVFDSVPSTLDVAHELAAADAPAGTLVLADAQSAGRGRMGRPWQSDAGAGVWLTIIERPAREAAASLSALPLRVGLAIAPALEPFASSPVQLKWPNDVYLDGGKLAGVLAEARWRSEAMEWIAVGVGVNVRAPVLEHVEHDAGPPAAGLRAGVSRATVLEAIVPAIRSAAAALGPLSDEERAAFARRDLAAGRRCIEPVPGRVRGIAADGALVIADDTGRVHAMRGGSLVLQPESTEVRP